ncbi:uncharacterized protein SRS1_10053 [Sporisorium reilianum f. sp. reilianum]|uniref:Uncharacterized protein n=1 Tax=Sporisorium reilianum f. sp. reilianum TaxID=72559 RepID=A0A2N8ULD4_9BASI|nr:uncharacterized protein SRS1_10053 [Sporisorium reilianum f. sp. reilianum]
MHVRIHSLFGAFIGVSFALLCIQPVFVLSGGRASADRGQSSAINISDSGRAGAARPGLTWPESSTPSLQTVERVPQLPGSLNVDLTPGPVLQSAIPILATRLRSLGNPEAIAAIQKIGVHGLKGAQHLIATQMASNPSKKQFIPVLQAEGLKTYAMLLERPTKANWPRAVGRMSGEAGIHKAALFSVFRTEQGQDGARSIVLHGLARIQRVDNFDQTGSEAQGLMHDVPEMLRF